MNRHLGLLADLNEHELAHTNVVFFGDGAPRVEINLVSRQGLQQVLEGQVVAMALLLELVENYLQDALAVVHLTCDSLA